MCTNPRDPHIVVAMSGGVDSSVAALLLKRAGYRVSAVFMKNWNDTDADGRCRWEDDVEDVLSVCESLDILVNTVDLSQAYRDSVFDEFIGEYRRGRTPNPDILCNREIKFKAFLQHALGTGGDIIRNPISQTGHGHYAKVPIVGRIKAIFYTLSIKARWRGSSSPLAAFARVTFAELPRKRA